MVSLSWGGQPSRSGDMGNFGWRIGELGHMVSRSWIPGRRPLGDGGPDGVTWWTFFSVRGSRWCCVSIVWASSSCVSAGTMGTFTKAIRVVAWVQRFIQNLKSSLADRWKGDLSFDELQAAKQWLIRAEQENAFSAELDALRKGRKIPKCSPLVKLSPFVAEDGFLHVQGRLQFSQLCWEEKHPIILPKSHLTLLLTRFQHSLMKHAGVSAMISSLRNQFWILGVRRLAKRVKRECVLCKRQDLSPCQQPMSPLPDLRVTQSFPFAVTGLDHAGPLYCCDFPRKKFWVLLFTCGVIRAVHLELVQSLSTEQTLLALRRLAARWVWPSGGLSCPCAGRPATSIKVAAGCDNTAISGLWRSGQNRWGQNSVW